ncbi:hypothetical protein, variant 4 [Batrachochytrium dendrobatidis JEL423]|uniref:Protein kinase domain-containing protein n=1 Tax=Batrachochytrium dendrobatidis (strain JEL423) TaxID=403673 RepID=A0A177WVE6_BATDL|nr:hypothetical protein, variant 4 [Batrachochytrium dendrobatidis JEL423]
MRAVENIIQERRLLEEIESNFICNMRYAFQDDENLFMVIDLMLGGDLRFHLDRMGVFKEDMIRLYTAEIACGLAYLHSKNIVHRDLKPDNILLNETGHAHLTDFNIAVRFRDDKPLTAVAGSMAYMAPEVLSKKGYFSSVDWWSLGVIIFELAIGKRPFRAKTNEGLTYAIMHEDLAFSSHGDCLNPDLIDAIRQFVCRDIRQRMGTKDAGGMEKLRQHPFFSILNWEQVETKTYPAPFVPDVGFICTCQDVYMSVMLIYTFFSQNEPILMQRTSWRNYYLKIGRSRQNHAKRRRSILKMESQKRLLQKICVLWRKSLPFMILPKFEKEIPISRMA